MPYSEPADVEDENEDAQKGEHKHWDLHERHDLLTEAQFLPRRRIAGQPEVSDLRHDLLETHTNRSILVCISRSPNVQRSGRKPLEVVAVDHHGHADHVRQPSEAKEAEGQEIQHAKSRLPEVETVPSEPS